MSVGHERDWAERERQAAEVFETSKAIRRLKHVMPRLLQKKRAKQKAEPRAEGRE